MREAVIVSVARTPIGKAYRGAFNDTDAPVLAAHCVTQALARAGVEGAEVEDLILGCAAQQGNQGYNIARLTVAAAGLPVTRRRHDHRPDVCLGADGGRDRGEADRAGPHAGHRRGRRRIHQPCAEQAQERLSRADARGDRAHAAHVHADDRDRRDRRASLRRVARGAGRSTRCRASSEPRLRRSPGGSRRSSRRSRR